MSKHIHLETEKERPIIFNGAMVRAILDDRKTQTRRLVTLREFCRSPLSGYDWHFRDRCGCWNDVSTEWLLLRCPYGKVGDKLWVRETFCVEDDGKIVYRADGAGISSLSYLAKTWRPSIHMPRWASRITLQITGIRVERVQDINQHDALCEGVPRSEDFPIEPFSTYWCPICSGAGTVGGVARSRGDQFGWTDMDCDECNTPQKIFRNMWNYLYAEKRQGWYENPWVWVISFEGESSVTAA